MRKFVLLFLVILFNSNLSPAQEVIFVSTQHHHNKIKYQPGSVAGFLWGNEIIREIAKDVLKDPQRVLIQINYSTSIEILNVQGKNLLNLYYSNSNVSGDTICRKFSVKDVLQPAFIHLKICWAKKKSPDRESVTSFSVRINKSSDDLILSGNLPAFDSCCDTLYLKDISFEYDSLAFRDFKAKIRLINDYYASRAVLDSLSILQHKIELDDVSKIPISFIQVEESDKILDCILKKKFQENLLNQNEDHLRLMEKLKSDIRNGRSIHYNFYDLLMSSGAINWNGNIQQYADYFTSRVFNYIRMAQLMGDLQGDIYQDYLDNWFSYSIYQDDRHITETILAKMFPNAKRDTLVSFMQRQLYYSYLRLSSRLLEQEQYAETMALINHAEKLRKMSVFILSMPEADSIRQHAANGIYNSFLAIASGCILSKKPDMAETYLGKAEEYRNKYKQLIRSDSLYRKITLDLILFRLNSPNRIVEDIRIRELLYNPE